MGGEGSVRAEGVLKGFAWVERGPGGGEPLEGSGFRETELFIENLPVSSSYGCRLLFGHACVGPGTSERAP